MNLQENVSVLQKKLSKQDKLFHELRESPADALEGWARQTGEESISGVNLQELVKLRTQQLEDVVNDLQQTQIALMHAQKMESVGELATGMAHEINTPLQYIGGNLEFMQQAFEELTHCVATTMNLLEQSGIEDAAITARKKKVDFVLGRLPKAIEQSREGVDNLSRIVRAMRRFSHITEERVEANINDCIDSTLTVSKGEWKYIADVKFEADENLPNIHCLPGEINQALLNMIVNAAHAIEDKLGEDSHAKGEISIRTYHSNEFVCIEISDTGAGIPKEVEDRIFDQFFTTKEVGKGTGQGLAISRTIFVEKHGGKIDVISNPGEGTSFTIFLPRDWNPE